MVLSYLILSLGPLVDRAFGSHNMTFKTTEGSNNIPIHAAMSASLPGNRDLPASQYNLNTYWGRVRQSAEIADPR